jgi:hypothetical protein
MPKKKKNDAPKAFKLPKQIAGIKIGKELRGAIEPVLRWGGHPLVSDILTAAVAVGADAITKKRSTTAGGTKTAKSAKSSAPEEKPDLGLVLAIAAGEIASLIVASYEKGESGTSTSSAKGKAKSQAKTKAKPKKELDDNAKRVALAREIS